ncbi:hypothetical protein Daus18300_010775 [Diaporthe australafricana]|uniref:Uncharacterized protein n=1 Tax=Diaporthe australafricana TaxID=127596 RepID=A0ABR3W9B6_9PEZI
MFWVLFMIAGWVLKFFGFGVLGPTAGTFAPWWQAFYAGNVPQGSLFSFFQWAGMAV